MRLQVCFVVGQPFFALIWKLTRYSDKTSIHIWNLKEPEKPEGLQVLYTKVFKIQLRAGQAPKP